MSVRKSSRILEARALVARVVPYGESDVILTLLSPDEGKLSVSARGARAGLTGRAGRKFAGALEPFHTIEVVLRDRGGEIGTLQEARVLVTRSRLAADLAALEAGGLALRWARHVFSARTPEPSAFARVESLLDALEAGRPPRASLVAALLHLLTDVGFRLDFERCVRCGRACPARRSAEIDVQRGGLVCQACGGARDRLDGETRMAALAVVSGELGELSTAQAEALLPLLEATMRHHAAFEGDG